jgi:hypothetical protein
VEVGHKLHLKKHFRPNTVENRELLDAYVRNLRLRFKDEKRVTILPFLSWQMHNNVIKYALELVDTNFVYVLQHDEIFDKKINHTAMVKTMIEHPDLLRKVEFGRNANTICSEFYFFRGPCSCKEDEVSHINGANFVKHSGWSDQCHFTTKKYYETVLELIGAGKKHPEPPMNKIAHRNCTEWGAHFYGSLAEGPFIQHVHGRFANGDVVARMVEARKKDSMAMSANTTNDD